MPAQERWSRKNAGSCQGLRSTTVAGGRGGRSWIFYLLESHMTYLAGSRILRSWPGIQLKLPEPERSIRAQQASSTHQCEYRGSKNVRVYCCCAVLCVILDVMCIYVIYKFLVFGTLISSKIWASQAGNSQAKLSAWEAV
jgi:hypothetical protein